MIGFSKSGTAAPVTEETYQRFYLTKVALGEGCGCAEHATRLRDLEEMASHRSRQTKQAFIAPRLRAAALRLVRLFLRGNRRGLS
jgi:hypothetical protein